MNSAYWFYLWKTIIVIHCRKKIYTVVITHCSKDHLYMCTYVNMRILQCIPSYFREPSVGVRSYLSSSQITPYWTVGRWPLGRPLNRPILSRDRHTWGECLRVVRCHTKSLPADRFNLWRFKTALVLGEFLYS